MASLYYTNGHGTLRDTLQSCLDVVEKSSPQGQIELQPRILCNVNGVLPHLQMGVAVMGFVEDFRYGFYNS